MSKSFMINRRTALGGAAALAAGAALPGLAQDNKRIVVGTWGGDYSRLLAKNIETPLLAPEGWDVVKDEANAPPRRAKMMAEKALRRGTSDVQGLSANDMYEVNEQGLAEQIDYSKMPNAANLIPAMKYPYGIGHIYSGKVVLYNPKLDGRHRRASPTRSIPSTATSSASSTSSTSTPCWPRAWRRAAR